MEYSENIEMYLKTIYVFEEKGVKPAKIADIAKELKVSSPSTLEMLKKMEKKKLVKYSSEGMTLTPSGKKLAKKLVRNLRLVECLLSDILKVPVDNDFACKVEHHVSEEIAQAIKKALKNPKQCPHGHEIPVV